jgi:hypothetical protein
MSMPPRRRSTRDASFDNALNYLLDGLRPAVERLGQYAADELIRKSKEAQDGWREVVGRSRDRVLPPPDTHLLVWQRVMEGGEVKDRWMLLDRNDPNQSMEKLMEGWESDPSVRAQMVFEGKMLMRGNKDRAGNEAQPS